MRVVTPEEEKSHNLVIRNRYDQMGRESMGGFQWGDFRQSKEELATCENKTRGFGFFSNVLSSYSHNGKM